MCGLDFNQTTYIPSLISQFNGRKMFFIKLDSDIFYINNLYRQFKESFIEPKIKNLISID